MGVWEELAAPRDPAIDPRPWDEDGLYELRHTAMQSVTMGQVMRRVLTLGFLKDNKL